VVRPRSSLERAGTVSRPRSSLERAGTVVRPRSSLERAGTVLRPRSSLERAGTVLRPRSSLDRAGNVLRPRSSLERAGTVVRPRSSLERSETVLRPQSVVQAPGTAINASRTTRRNGPITQPQQRNIAWPDNRERDRSGSRNAALPPRFSLHTRAPDGRMQPLDFDGEIVWAADALAMLIPNDREAARALPNEVFVQDQFRPGVFLRSTQRMIEETADEPSDNERDDEPSDNESDDVDEGRNSQGQDFSRYVKNRYPKKTKQHELMTSRSALGQRDTNIAR
jgi:hypothetical protein